jgi:hypothetical protein
MRCPQCGQEVPATARFCSGCGTAAPAPVAEHASVAPPSTGEVGPASTGDVGPGSPRRSIAPFLVTAVVLIALVIGGFAIVRSGEDSTDTDATSAGGTDSAAGAPAPSTTDASAASAELGASTTIAITSTIGTTAPPSSPPTTQAESSDDPNAVALTSLAATIAADRPAVDAHLGRWVPQVSAKRNGLTWEGVDYGFAEIEALHADLDQRYGALLVDGSEYNFRLDGAPMVGWFVSFVDVSYPTPEGALDWCRANGIDRNNCAAKLITNDPDAGVTLVLQ